MKLKTVAILILIFLMSCKTEVQTDNLLVMDPSITTGTLDNGLTYFIRGNNKPEKRVELRLVVKAGSVLENDNQRGLAHFVEHMAFNGTKNFPKDKLVKYLESLGMGFGPEINAYTSFDETVYKLSVPSDNQDAIDNAFLILEDWAHQVTLSTEEIEKERGVIVEEWRLGRGVQGRFWDRLFPALLENSKYSERLPIGIVDVIKNCDPNLLRDYYRTWYRPDLMSVIVVGDIDTELAKEKVNKHFNFSGPEDKKNRLYFDIPIEDDLDIEIITDSEKTSTDISYYIKREWKVIDNLDNYKEYITEILSVIMFNRRMEEIYTKEDSPFLSASSGFGDLVYGVDSNMFFAQSEDDKVYDALEALLLQIESVNRNGYSESELDRAKSLILMIIENYYNERENKKSADFAQDIIKYITTGYVPLESGYDREIFNKIMPEITLDEVNGKAASSFSGFDRTLAIHTPVDNNKLPQAEEIKDLFNKISTVDIEKREEKQITRDLFDLQLEKGTIISQEVDDISGVEILELSNGISVYLKKTDFKSDEILLSGVSYGGLSLVEDHELLSGVIATNLVSLSGLNGFSNIELDRILTGRNVSLSPWIGKNLEGFSGSSSVKDLETLFQLLHLHFVKPGFNSESYNVLINNIENYLEKRENSPETIFNDRVEELLGNGHIRVQPFDENSLKDSDYEETKRIYKERFNDSSDFDFIFTGSFDTEVIKELIAKYLGSLPSTYSNESSRDLGVRSPKNIVRDVINKGLEDKSTVEIVFSGESEGDYKDDFIMSMVDKYLDEALRLEIREELSGTYGVSVFSRFNYLPYNHYVFGIYFGCEPGREEELIEATFNVIKDLLKGNIDEEIVESVKANYIRSMELELKENSFWSKSITDFTVLNRPYSKIGYDSSELITKDNLLNIARRYIDFNRYIQVTLEPEE